MMSQALQSPPMAERDQDFILGVVADQLGSGGRFRGSAAASQSRARSDLKALALCRRAWHPTTLGQVSSSIEIPPCPSLAIAASGGLAEPNNLKRRDLKSS